MRGQAWYFVGLVAVCAGLLAVFISFIYWTGTGAVLTAFLGAVAVAAGALLMLGADG